MITRFCMVGRHTVDEETTFRLVEASCTEPPQPLNGFPRGSVYTLVPWYPREGGPSAIIVCAHHDTGVWASAPTSDRR